MARGLSRPVRRQNVDLGGFRAVKHGAPWGPGDIYYRLMEMSWAAFIAAIAAVFLLINLGFGAVYAAMPGAIEHMAAGSLAEGFFFSVETYGTVGYGNMAPATHAGHAVAVAEIMIGLFMTATITGLIFARFARPTDSLIFSNQVVINHVRDQRAIMLRVAGTRSHALADANAQLGILETITLPTGRVYRRFADLPLLNPHNAMMGLAWTLVHIIDDDSRLKPILDDPAADLRLMVTVGGLDTLLSNQTFGSRNYTRDDLRHDEEFVDIFDNHGDGSVHVDLTRFHETQPAAEGPPS